MRVEISDSFLQKLHRQVAYIATDKTTAARKFKKDILHRCKKLVDHPFKFKKSIYFERDDIRDMTFKGYTIVYKVDSENDLISIFALVKYEEEV